jgi:hypothetical protein
MMSRLHGVVFCFLALSSCRISKVGTDTSGGGATVGGGNAVSSSSPVIQPQRQTEPGVQLTVNLDSSGKVKESLSLRLDYFPAPRPDGVSVPTCYDEIAGHLLVGRLVCGANGNIGMDVTAGQVNQKCYTANPKLRVAASSPIVLAGCVGPATLTTVKYEPDVKLEVGN